MYRGLYSFLYFTFFILVKRKGYTTYIGSSPPSLSNGNAKNRDRDYVMALFEVKEM
jgi:hypothetical protein